MKMTKLAILILAIALALYILVPGLSWGEVGAGPGSYASRPVTANTTRCLSHKGGVTESIPLVEQLLHKARC